MRKTRIIIFGLLVWGWWLSSFSLGYEIVPVENGATIKGTIRFNGTPHAPRMFPVQKNPEICGKERPLVKVQVTDGLLKGAVIVLEGVVGGKPFPAEMYKADLPGKGEFFLTGGETPSLDVRLRHCNFGPFTGVLLTKNPVNFTNHDDIKHTLHTYVGLGKKFNMLRTIHNRDLHAHTTLERQFSPKVMKEGRVVVLTCDRHEFMENWLYLVDTPYYAVSDSMGVFSIDQIPPGQYTLKVWHPVLGMIQRELTSIPNGTIDLDLAFPPK